MVLAILLSILLIALTVYLIVYVIYPSVHTTEVLSKMTPLEKKTDIVMPDVAKSTLLGSSGSSVMGFIKIQNGDRTATFQKGGMAYVPLIQSEHNWYFEIMSHPTDATSSSARLRVITADPKNSNASEVISLPSLPKQKWVFVAILREGRRFDVIYDDRIVASQRLRSYPVVVSSPLSIGAKGLAGSANHFVIKGERMNPLDVERERLAHVDSNQSLVEDNPILTSLPVFPSIVAECPSGLPCQPVTRPPSNPLYEWKSPYA